MPDLVIAAIASFFSALRSRRDLVLENLALRHQVAVLNRTAKHKRLSNADRFFWAVLSRWWQRWKDALVIVRPETVIRWHRTAFRAFWTRKSKKGKPGRPTVSAEATVSKYLLRGRKPPSQTWRTFLKNHASEIAAIDFFTVATARFRQLYVFVVLAHDRRRVLHFNVTDSPTAAWTAQQVVEAFPWSTAPRYLLRDRDGVYGDEFRRRVKALDIEEVLTAPRSPWQNPFVERIIGSIRRECLDHMIVFSEAHLRRILAEYFDYYHRSPTHLSLAKDSPDHREAEPFLTGPVRSLAMVGGLHHRYTRKAA